MRWQTAYQLSQIAITRAGVNLTAMSVAYFLMPHQRAADLPQRNQRLYRRRDARSSMPENRANLEPAAQKTTATNTPSALTVSGRRLQPRLRGTKSGPPKMLHTICCRSLFCRSYNGAERALDAAANRRGRIPTAAECGLVADSSEARQLMEDLGSAEDFLPSLKNRRKRKICWK